MADEQKEPASTTPVLRASGDSSQVIAPDLMERAIEEDAHWQSEERFRLLVEGVKDYAIFMLDPNGYVSSWNEGVRRIKGYEASEIIGQHFSVFYPPEARARNRPELALEVAARDGRFEDDGWRVRKDGGRFWANVVITALRDRTGTLRGFAKVTRDLTERKRVESLEEANRRMNDFLSMVSHELRTPLNAVLGWARLLRSGRLDAAAVERGLETIERNAVAQARLVEDLLDVSRIVSGGLRLGDGVVDLAAALRSALDSVRLSANAKGVGLDVSVDEGEYLVRGDRARLQQVAWTLLSNAIKFTPKDGSVRASLTRAGSLAELTVSDTGQGIAPEFLPHVFEHFRQADAGTTRKHGGLGLGLAIVKYLVEAHGGIVEAESEGAGLGATFRVRLPLVDSDAVPATAKSP
jgi:PAS domain S-box-containing protein